MGAIPKHRLQGNHMREDSVVLQQFLGTAFLCNMAAGENNYLISILDSPHPVGDDKNRLVPDQCS